MLVLAVIVGLIVITLLYAVSLYNKLVAQRERFKNAFAQIDVQLKRRYDLIPNLVETAKGYMAPRKGDAGCRHEGPQRGRGRRAEGG